jgi:two-component system sensor histidine kinase EvgS
VRDAIARAAGGEFVRFETTNRSAEGGVRKIDFSLSPIQDNDGNVVYLLPEGRDITEIRQAEEERSQLQKQLNQAQKMEAIGRLAGGVAHDFNNMLTVILGSVQLLLGEEDLPDSIQESLRQVEIAAERSADLTRQLLAFARQQAISPKVLDLNEILEGLLKMLRRLIGEDIELAWSPGEGVWPVKVDPSQVDQILANLCVNARDAIDGVGKIAIETSNVEFDATYCDEHAGFVPGEFVQLAVSDDGCGMDAETLASIFEPFFTTKGEGEGTGLGLATVYGIVKQNDGFVNVYSEPGYGTTFRIYLPRHAAEPERRMLGRPLAATPTGNETILLVEDEPAILRLGKRMLEGLGYRVLTARDPKGALATALAHSGEVHLLITDVIMPGMNGRELAAQLTRALPELKCLFMSGYTAEVTAHHGVLDEGVHFMQKPFSRRDLASKVREALDAP